MPETPADRIRAAFDDCYGYGHLGSAQGVVLDEVRKLEQKLGEAEQGERIASEVCNGFEKLLDSIGKSLDDPFDRPRDVLREIREAIHEHSLE